MNKLSFKIVPSANNTYIQAEGQHVDEDGVISTKRGFIQVLPEKAPALLAKLESGERLATFGQYNRNQGLYEVKVTAVGVAETAPATANEIEHS